MVVVPAPRSITAAPRSASSSAITAEPADIGRRHHGLDLEMAALDHQHQIARRRDVGGHHMHVDAELARQHAARIADAAHAVERIADRQRMQHDAARRGPNDGMPAASTRAMSPSVTPEPATLTLTA